MPMISWSRHQAKGQFASMGIEGPKSGVLFQERPHSQAKGGSSPLQVFKLLNLGVICYVAFDTKYVFPTLHYSIPLLAFFFCSNCYLCILLLAQGLAPCRCSVMGEGMKGQPEGQCHSSEKPQVGGVLLRSEEAGLPQSQAVQRLPSPLSRNWGSILPPLQEDAGQSPGSGISWSVA